MALRHVWYSAVAAVGAIALLSAGPAAISAGPAPKAPSRLPAGTRTSLRTAKSSQPTAIRKLSFEYGWPGRGPPGLRRPRIRRAVHELAGPAPARPGGANRRSCTRTPPSHSCVARLLTTTDGYGTSSASTVTACYDPNGDRTTVVAADGNASGTATCEQSYPWVVSSSSYPAQAKYQTTYSYDSAGEPVSTTSPATTAAPHGATTTTSYDPDGDPLSTTSPNGITATMTYPVPGEPAGTVSYSGSSAHSVSYSYDANGDLTSMTDGTGTSTYSIDPFGRLASATNGAGQTVTYAYNADGDTTGITYPLPASATWAATDTVSYGYNHADALTSVTDFNNHKITITPNANGAPTSETLGSMLTLCLAAVEM